MYRSNRELSKDFERERGEYNRAKKEMLKKHTQDFWEDQTKVENEWLENFTKLHKEKKFRDEAKLRNTIIKNPGGWHQLMETSGGSIMADSSRMEWKLVQPENAPMKNYTATTVTVNREDQSATFAYIIKTYPKPSPKSFDEARAQVVNDYQLVLEERWIDGLRKQYPVVVNDAIFTQVLNTLQH
jgi:hypothetical protein